MIRKWAFATKAHRIFDTQACEDEEIEELSTGYADFVVWKRGI